MLNVVSNPIVTHLPQAPQHILSGRSPKEKSGRKTEKYRFQVRQTHNSLQMRQMRKTPKHWLYPSMHSPSALLLVGIQTLIVGFGPLCFAGCIRLQQSTSEWLCTEINNMKWCYQSFITHSVHTGHIKLSEVARVFVRGQNKCYGISITQPTRCSLPWSCDSWRRMGGHGESGLEGPVVMDCATDITAEGGIGAAFWSTLGLIGSSVTTTEIFRDEIRLLSHT